jgi:hypothetical protein
MNNMDQPQIHMTSRVDQTSSKAFSSFKGKTGKIMDRHDSPHYVLFLCTFFEQNLQLKRDCDKGGGRGVWVTESALR